MRSTASVATLLGSLLLVPAPADAHLSLTPGRFEGGAAAKAQAQMAPAPPPSCQMQFSLGGDKFDVSSLSVDVGGWIAENTVDEFHYCINVCAVVTSERNCICYPCGATEYPASQVDKDPVKGETCEACEAQHQNDVVPLSQISLSLCAFCSRAPWPCRSRRAEEQHLVGQH